LLNIGCLLFQGIFQDKNLTIFDFFPLLQKINKYNGYNKFRDKSLLPLYPGVIQIKGGIEEKNANQWGSRVEPMRFEEPCVAKEN
jgi:hypothetical protein